MNILESLTELEKSGNFNKEGILSSGIDAEALFFMVSELVANNSPEYDDLFPVFEELREVELKKGKLNIFEEYLTIKINYLQTVYKVNPLILNALAHLVGIVYLDFEFGERYFNDDKFFTFYIKRFNEFKHSNEITALKILNNLDLDSLHTEGEQLNKLIEELQTLAK